MLITHTRINLDVHIRSLSPYTKLPLIMDTALSLFCFLSSPPPELPPQGVYRSPPCPRLPYLHAVVSLPVPLPPADAAVSLLCQEPWQVCIHHHGAAHTACSAQTVIIRHTHPPAGERGVCLVTPLCYGRRYLGLDKDIRLFGLSEGKPTDRDK